MTRGLVAFFAVVVALFVKSILIGWLANRRGARAIHVAAVGNTVILTSVVLAIDQFRREGLTVYSSYFLVLMIWLAYSGARSGNVGYLAVKANPHRADPS